MLYLQTKKLFRMASVFTVLFFTSCGFMNLRPVSIVTIPGSPWSVLLDTDSPVAVLFDTEMDKTSVEDAFFISSPGGIVDGKFHWDKNDMLFLPDYPWLPGIRYALILRGSINSLDGRETAVSIEVPFFVMHRMNLPYLVSFSPNNNESVNVFSSVVLELCFSESMDRKSTEDALRLELPGEKIFEWLGDDSILRLSTDRPLNPWTVYSWTITEKALSKTGSPLAKEYGSRFITDLEREFIRVLRILPLMPPLPGNENVQNSVLWGAWLPSAPDISTGPGYGHGIGIEFNKTPDSESLQRAVSFFPSLPGRVEILSPNSAVFIPLREPEPDVIYTMRISGTLRDTEGLRMGEDHEVYFIYDLPFLEVLSISSMLDLYAPEFSSLDPSIGNFMEAKSNTGKILRIIVNFSIPFAPDNYSIREEIPLKISLTPFFPLSLPPVAVRQALWFSPDRLFLEWEGPEGGSSEVPHYYRLFLPGGIGGINNGQGAFLKNDLIIFLEAVE